MQRNQEGEEGKVRWENQEEAEACLERPEGTQEVAVAAGCVNAIWMLPRHQRTPGIEWINLHVVPGGGPSGMGMSSSVSSSSSSLSIPGGGPSGMGISSSVFSAYTQFNQQASILD